MPDPLFSIRGVSGEMPTSVLVLFTYRHENAWVFDDADAGLVKEPFVAGIDTMIDRLTADIPNAAAGFRLSFATEPFAGYRNSLTWLRADPVEGNWYRADDDGSEGWLCPALFCYFPSPPGKIFVGAEALVHRS